MPPPISHLDIYGLLFSTRLFMSHIFSPQEASVWMKQAAMIKP